MHHQAVPSLESSHEKHGWEEDGEQVGPRAPPSPKPQCEPEGAVRASGDGGSPVFTSPWLVTSWLFRP